MLNSLLLYYHNAVVLNRGGIPHKGGIFYFQGGNYQWFPTGGPQSDFWGSMSLFMEKMKEYVIVKAVVDIRGGELGSCLGK